MRYIKIISTVVTVAVLSGCSSCMCRPSASLIENTPIIKIGSTVKPPKEFILFIPANSNFPMEFSVKGDAFNEPRSSKVMVSFKKDMYLYNHWASIDGKHWIDFHTLLDVNPLGGFDTMGANIELKMDYAK